MRTLLIFTQTKHDNTRAPAILRTRNFAQNRPSGAESSISRRTADFAKICAELAHSLQVSLFPPTDFTS